MPIEPIKKQSVVDIIVDQIKELIIKGELQPGDKLDTERELANKFRVGRPSVREAIKVLNSMGLIVRKTDGTYVNDDITEIIRNPIICNLLLNQSNVHDLFEARIIIELYCLGHCIDNIPERVVKSLEEQLEYMETLINDPEKYMEADIKFHLTIISAAKNKVLVTFLETVRGLMRIGSVKLLSNQGMASISLGYHKKIVKAIKEQDREASLKHMRKHLNTAKEQLISVL